MSIPIFLSCNIFYARIYLTARSTFLLPSVCFCHYFEIERIVLKELEQKSFIIKLLQYNDQRKVKLDARTILFYYDSINRTFIRKSPRILFL